MRIRGLIATVVAGGAAAVASVFLSFPPHLDRTLLPRAAVLLAITIASELVAIRLAHGSQSEVITLTEIALVADVVLLPAPLAVGVALGGVTIALLLQRRAIQKTLFNIGQYSLGVVAAAALYHGPGGGEFGTSEGLVWLLAGVTAFTGINLMTISAILAATQNRRFFTVVRQEGGLSVALGLGCSTIGIVAVSQYLSRPALVPLVLAPTLALHLAFRGWIKQKTLVAQMEEEKTKLERVIEHSREGIVLADASGAVALWSPSMERMTGVPAAEAHGKQLAFLLRGRGSRGEALTVDVAARDDAFELELITPKGDVRWLHGQHGPGYAEDGTLLFDVLVVTDVTRQREVDRLKSDFISTVSHELRTPLTPIKGFASLLLRRSDQLPPDRRREALVTIIERTDHLGRLVEDLLLAGTMSREGERRLPEVARQSSDLTALVEKVVGPFRIGHPHRDFAVTHEASATVFVDPLRAEQMIAHLISNAVKFSDEATPVAITVSVADGAAHVAVRDEGRGIPLDKQEEIFERFKRLEDPLRMETGGAGLGLFIARQLAHAMDGTVTVESEPGRGSTFTVSLPLLQSKAQSPSGEQLAG